MNLVDVAMWALNLACAAMVVLPVCVRAGAFR
jgi:hypothetical protein